MIWEYDVIAIGSGPAGQAVAFQCRSAGLSVAIIESEDYGGTCPLRGCNPKKVLFDAAYTVYHCRSLQGKGISGEAGIAWTDLIKFKRTFTEPVPIRVKQQLTEAGIHVYHGPARFTGRNSIEVGKDTFVGKFIAIATGAIPATLGILGEEYLADAEKFMDLRNLPKRILFIGGGYISFELAWVAAMTGCKVKILEATDSALRQFEQDLVHLLIKSAEDAGIETELEVPVRSVEQTEKGFIVTAEGGQQFETDLVVHGAGRAPNIAGLGLTEGEVDFSDRGIVVNNFMQSVSNPSVYAIGDVAAAPFQLIPSAHVEARAAANNILKGNYMEADYRAIPGVAFTMPPLASVGMTEDEAKSAGKHYQIKFEDTSSWLTSRGYGIKYSAAKILVEKETDRILGGHILGEHAEEAINVLSLAIKNRLTVREIMDTSFAYPTAVYDLRYILS